MGCAWKVGLGLVWLGLGGCAAVPAVRVPAVPVAVASVAGEDVPAQWWALFKSEELDRMIRAAFAQNPTLEAAQAALREAQENYNARAGRVRYPEVTAVLSSARQKSSPAAAGLSNDSGGGVFDLHHASVNVGYAFDFFGGGRRALEDLKARVDYQNFQLEAVRLSLAANIVTTVIREAALREQLAALKAILISEEKQLGLLDAQMALGGVARAEVLSWRAQVEQTRAAVPPVEKELFQVRHQRMVLAGKFPAEEAAGPRFDLASISEPAVLPIALSSSLVRQRPDIRAAEALVQAASARAGVAAANLYPQITLNGSYGSQSGQAAAFFNANSVVWSFGAGLVQPVIDGGRLRAERRAALAALDAASAQFRQVVFLAYADVADVLRALGTDARTLQACTDALAAAGAALDMTQQQMAVGAVSYSLLLNAERQYQQARIGLIEARAARLADAAALFQALGGGWWHRAAEGSGVALKE